MMSDYQVVGKIDQVGPSTMQVITSTMQVVDLDGREIVVANQDGSFFAFSGRCTCVSHFASHSGSEAGSFGHLSEGKLEDGTVACPLHSTVFDLRTGTPISGFGEIPLNTYEVQQQNGELRVSIMSDTERRFWNDKTVAVGS